VLVVLMVLGARAGAQTTAPGREGAITGQVVDAATGRPVSAAIVTLDVRGRIEGPQILTGADGRFAFTGLPAQDGSYTVTARKGGYLEGASGRRRPGGASQAVVLNALTRTADVAVRVWKSGAIQGTVIDEAGEPVIGVQMRLAVRQSAGATRQFTPVATAPAITDDRGMYRFSSLIPGDYIVLASLPPVSLKTTVFEDIARTGRASGELGLLLPGGSSYLDSGDARIALRPGTPVPSQGADGRLRIYPTTFHPSAAAPAQASIVTLASGEERSNVDVQLAPVPTARVSGTLISSAGPVEATPVRLMPTGLDGVPLDALAPVTSTDASGAFVFAVVPAGSYTLRAFSRGGSADLGWVDLPVTVAGDDVDGIVAVMNAPLALSGRFQFDGALAPPPVSPERPMLAGSLLLESADGPNDRMTVAMTGSDRNFRIAGYLPGRYRVRVTNSPSGWMFKSAMLNGVDVSETPFELTRDIADLMLTFTDRWSGISGSVQGRGAEGATVLAFTTDAQAWTTAGPNSRRFRSGRAATATGAFGISSLPPGDYYVIAVREEDAVDWRDPATLDLLARAATQITILEGEHKTIDLQMREVKR
jgi:hypothetical protein